MRSTRYQKDLLREETPVVISRQMICWSWSELANGEWL